ncbi:MAG TPA: hypothetical protein VEZ11_06435 [Thermoanaerobaculia bacterium]|nr:hypothetical protein [Thermoanaerobaculia bacterium]
MADRLIRLTAGSVGVLSTAIVAVVAVDRDWSLVWLPAVLAAACFLVVYAGRRGTAASLALTRRTVQRKDHVPTAGAFSAALGLVALMYLLWALHADHADWPGGEPGQFTLFAALVRGWAVLGGAILIGIGGLFVRAQRFWAGVAIVLNLLIGAGVLIAIA